jgi:hypothetical protein
VANAKTDAKMKKNIKKAKDGITGVTRFTKERGSSYPVEKKVEYDTTGYSTGKKMFPGTKTETFKSGEKKTTPMTGDRKSVDIVIKNPMKYEGQQTQKTKTPATGSDIRKYMTSSSSIKLPLTEQTVKANKTGKSESAPAVKNNTSTSAPAKTKEKKTGGGGNSGRRRVDTPVSKAATPSPVIRTEKITPKKKLAPIPLGLPERKRPTVARQYSSTERKINEQIEKVKKGEGVEAAQMKIKSLKEKEKAQQAKSQRQEKRSNNKALRKSVRAGKFNARQVRKSAK